MCNPKERRNVNENKRLFWMKVDKWNIGEIKDSTIRLAMEENDLWQSFKEYFEDLYNVDMEEQVFGSVRRGNYFWEGQQAGSKWKWEGKRVKWLPAYHYKQNTATIVSYFSCSYTRGHLIHFNWGIYATYTLFILLEIIY